MRMVSLNRGWLSTGGPFRKSTKRLAHQNSLILRNPSVSQKLTVVTRDHLVAALLTPKTDKVSHFEEELWIKTNNHTFPDWPGLGEKSHLNQDVGTPADLY